MKITKNKNGSFNLEGVSVGKLLAIVNAIDNQKNPPTSVAQDVKNLITNNREFDEAVKNF